MQADRVNVEHEIFKCMIIAVIIGTIEIITNVLQKHLEAIPGKQSADSLHTAAKLGTSHIIRTVLQSESGSLSGGDRRWFKRRSTGEKRPVTRDKINNYYYYY